MATTQTATATASTLLRRIETITVTPDENFDADAFFAKWDIGREFKDNFLGRTENTDGKPVGINLYVLEEDSLDRPIVRALGKLPKAALPNLATFAAAAATGRTFVGYLYDNDGIPWAVYCGQGGGYRNVEADSVGSPGEWHDGYHFASPANS